MEPGQLLVALLYLWLLIAIGVYVWRAYRRLFHGETRADRAGQRSGVTPAAAGPDTGSDAAVSADADHPVTPAPDPVRAPVAHLVEGISLPCGLLPVIGDELDPYRAVFATSGHTPGEVDEALAAELGRLGYELERETVTESVARRGDAVLHVRVAPESVNGSAAPPAAPVGAGRVIAELSS
jgi:hypothetical protein